eukprot:15464293-Alexandrium_andersonii.AAC.1
MPRARWIPLCARLTASSPCSLLPRAPEPSASDKPDAARGAGVPWELTAPALPNARFDALALALAIGG